jgi:arylsulfatase A-like enzyme
MKLMKTTLLFSLICYQLVMAERPNIIFILADDMGIGDISALNDESKIQTPNLDHFIKQGMVFTDAHTASAICTPTRYGLLTGRYPWRSELKEGVANGYTKALIAPELDTVPKLLKRAGYKTAMTGKWHLGFNWTFKDGVDPVYELQPDSKKLENLVDYTKPFKGGPVDCGFDYFYGMVASPGMPPYTFLENDRVAVLPTDRQAWYGPRDDFPAGKKNDYERWATMLRPGLKAPGFESNQVMLRYTEKALEYLKNQKAGTPFFLYVPYAAPHTPVVPRKPFLGTSKAGTYGDFVQELDWSIGQILHTLEEKGLAKNTLVFFSADNGHSPAGFPLVFEEKYNHDPEHGLRGHKAQLYEGGHRVPFAVRWPGKIKPGTVCETTICLNDLYATCAALTGQKINKNSGVDSYNMLGLLVGGSPYKRPSTIYSDYSGRFAIRKGDWKLILNPNPKQCQLFNLKNDLAEKQNKAQNPEFKSVMDDLMDTVMEVVANGRTTVGPVVQNDGPKVWKQLYWVDSKK